jgi:beta-1,4-mannosyltransferase
MKVVDMFGCGLPVCALNFECLDELVKHDINGMVFSCSAELSAQIQDLCKGFPENNSKLMQYRNNLSTYQSHRWNDYWKTIVLPLIEN